MIRSTFIGLALVVAACGGEVAPGDLGPGDADEQASDHDTTGDSGGDANADALTLSFPGGELIIAVAGETVTVSADVGTHQPPLAYVWSSSLDGVVSTEASLVTSTLAEGDHTIEVHVTDASGASAVATTAVHVLPRRFDWSHQVLPDAPPAAGDWMTSVKHQSTCGSCWSHAALGAMEARWNIQNGDPTLDIDLAEQYLIDCHHEGAVGCGGGAPEQAIDFIGTHGVPVETCDPFLAHNDVCSETCVDLSTPALYRIGPRRTFFGERAAVQSWTRDVLVHIGPVPRSMGGIYAWNPTTMVCDNLAGSHYVVVVGYDHDAGVWIAKNSWGPSWNGNGYLKIKYGACGMDAASIALGDVLAP